MAEWIQREFKYTAEWNKKDNVRCIKEIQWRYRKLEKKSKNPKNEKLNN
jgi:hypothetical protein